MTSLLWSFAAWCALALAMERHHEQAFGRPPLTGRSLGWRILGGAGLLGALAQPVATEGWALGTLHGVAALAVAGIAVPALLAWVPRHCVRLAAAAAVLGAWLAP